MGDGREQVRRALRKKTLLQLRREYQKQVKEALVEALSEPERLREECERAIKEVIKTDATRLVQVGLGFKPSNWGNREWEIDSNGTVAEHLRTLVWGHAQQWIKPAVKKLLSAMRPNKIEALKKRIGRDVCNLLDEHLREMTQQEAVAIRAELKKWMQSDKRKLPASPGYGEETENACKEGTEFEGFTIEKGTLATGTQNSTSGTSG